MRKILLILVIFGLAACVNVDDDMKEPPPPDERPPAQLPEDGETDDQEDSTGGEFPEEKSAQTILDEAKDKIASSFEVKLPSVITVSDEKYLAATVDSDALYYEVAYFETDVFTESNDAVLMQQTPMMIVKGTAYDSAKEAHEQIGYEPIQEGMPEIDLGDGITGYQDAGAGSSFITWHEGRWSFMMRARNDENGVAAGKELAREVVERLSKQLLPPPHENGAGLFSANDSDAVETNRLAWQEEHIVYEVYMSDALRLIDVVTNDFD